MRLVKKEISKSIEEIGVTSLENPMQEGVLDAYKKLQTKLGMDNEQAPDEEKEECVPLIETFEKSPRLSCDRPLRHANRAKYLRKKLHFDLVEKYSKIIEDTPDEKLGAWVGRCFLPVKTFMDSIFETTKATRVHYIGGIPLTAWEFLEAYTLAVWDLTKGVYRFDKDLEAHLPALDWDAEVPIDLFRDLPQWSIFVETPDWNLMGLEPYGFFVTLSHNLERHFELVFAVDLPDSEFLEVRLLLTEGTSYREMLDEMLVTQISKADLSALYKRAVDEIGVRYYDRTRHILDFPENYQNPISLDVKDLATECLNYIVPRLLFICTNPDALMNVTNPELPIERAKVANGTVKRLPKPSIIEVGKAIGDTLRSDGADAVEMNTSVVLNKKVGGISTESVLKNAYVLAQQQNAQLKKDNQQLTEESLAYLQQIDDVQATAKELEVKVYGLSHSLEWQQNKLNAQQKPKNADDTMRLFAKLIDENAQVTPKDALQIIEMIAGHRVQILPSAWESAETISSSQNGRKLLKSLYTLVTTYLDDYLQAGDNKARKCFGEAYKANESDSVRSQQKLKKLRIFSGHYMEQHIAVSWSERLYFEVDQDTKRVVIGYCGEHLPVSSL